MNKQISLLLVLLLCTTSSLFAKKKNLPELRQIIPLTELTSELLEEVARGDLPDVAIECASGIELTPKLSWHFRVISSLVNPLATLKVNESFYFRVVRKKAYVSHDLIVWERPDNWIPEKFITKVKLNGKDVLIETDSTGG